MLYTDGYKIHDALLAFIFYCLYISNPAIYLSQASFPKVEKLL